MRASAFRVKDVGYMKFFIYYELDEDTSKHVLQLKSYGEDKQGMGAARGGVTAYTCMYLFWLFLGEGCGFLIVSTASHGAVS